MSSTGDGNAIVEAIRTEADAYRAGEDRPLRGFVGVLAVYSAAAGASGLLVRRRGLPERVSAGDLALLAVATYKLSKLLSKEPVTSPLRAPFTRFAGTSGPAQLREEVRGDGARKAVGELLTCPFCVGHWVATGFIVALALAPRATRLVASTFAVTSAADFLHLAYSAAEKRMSG